MPPEAREGEGGEDIHLHLGADRMGLREVDIRLHQEEPDRVEDIEAARHLLVGTVEAEEVMVLRRLE